MNAPELFFSETYNNGMVMGRQTQGYCAPDWSLRDL